MPDGSSPDLVELFREAANAVTGDEWAFVTRDTPVSELKLDSLDLLELVGYVEDRLSMRLPDDALRDLTTVGALCDFIDAHRAATADAAV